MNKGRIIQEDRPSIVIDKFLGRNDRDSAWELELGELVSATDVDVTMKNKIRSRLGQTLKDAGSYNSLHGFGEYGLAVKNGYLVHINANLTVTQLRYIGTNDCSMAEHASKVFYTNTQILEYVENKIVHILPNPVDIYRMRTPPGQLLAVLGARLYVANGPYIYFTDVGKFHSVDMRQNVRCMESRVTMMMPVNDGMFISDVKAIYFAKGINPYKQGLMKVCNYPTLEGSGIEVNGKMVGEGVEGKAVAWRSREGVCVGFDGGRVVNMTERRSRAVNGVRAHSLYRNVGDVSQVVSVMY